LWEYFLNFFNLAQISMPSRLFIMPQNRINIKYIRSVSFVGVGKRFFDRINKTFTHPYTGYRLNQDDSSRGGSKYEIDFV